MDTNKPKKVARLILSVAVEAEHPQRIAVLVANAFQSLQSFQAFTIDPSVDYLSAKIDDSELTFRIEARDDDEPAR